MNETPQQILPKEEFWNWAYSDILSNASRGVLAEFLVGKALNCLSNSRVEWDAHDLKLPDGITVEVKSSAYIQSWDQKGKLSSIRFDIAEKLSWFSESNHSANQKNRPADIYVFCVLTEIDRTKVNPLDTRQWFFITMSTEEINKKFGNQKTVGLAGLEQAGGKRLTYDELKKATAELCNQLG